MPFGNEKEREEIVSRYNALAGGSTETDQTETSTETEGSDASTDDLEDAGTSTDETDDLDAEASTDETEDADDSTDDGGESDDDSMAKDIDGQKMVPHGAFHEERERRKALAVEVEKLQGQLSEVLQDFKRLAEKQPPTDSDSGDYVDPELQALKNEIADLRKFKNEFESSRAKEKQDEVKRTHEADVLSTDKRLDEAGYPGFIESTDAVGIEIRRLVAKDPGNKWLYSPAGWEKVYKEVVFPRLSTKFAKIHKSKLFKEKEELKGKQKIAGKVGINIAQPESDKSDDKWGYGDYIKFRASKQLA